MRPRRPLLVPLALATLAASSALGAHSPAMIRVDFPRVRIPAGANVETCWVVHVPLREPFDLGEWRLRHRGAGGPVAVRHFLVQQYLGDDPGAPPGKGDAPIEDRGCLELPGRPAGAADQQVLVAGGRTERGFLPPGLALPLVPTPAAPGEPPSVLALVMAANWANGSSRTRTVSTRVELRRARAGSVQRRLTRRRDASADATIVVPPFGTATASGAWRPDRDACVFEVSGAFHRRGRFLGVDHLDASGVVQNPTPTVANPIDPDRRHLFGMADYTDAGTRAFPRGFLVRAGEALAWTCWFENGLNGPVRLGCEEVASVTPGSTTGVAAVCPAAAPSDPACLAQGTAGAPRTGACVPASVVSGPPPDETCALLVSWWDAAQDSGCDLTAGAAVRGRP